MRRYGVVCSGCVFIGRTLMEFIFQALWLWLGEIVTLQKAYAKWVEVMLIRLSL